MNGPVDVLAAERDARTIYDIACIREDQANASREDVEFKAMTLRNYQFCAAVAELIEAVVENRKVTQDFANDGCVDNYRRWDKSERRVLAALARFGEQK